jgi:ABC-2 type transport system ATP-binding protein
MNSSPAIRVTNVYKSYKDVQALAGVSLEVPAGSVVGLLGPNGAGKTTLVRILTTLLEPDKGSAVVGGYDVVSNPKEVRHTIGLAGQYAAVDENLTGLENLRMVGRLYRLSKQDTEQRAIELLEQFNLMDASTRPIKTYSGGMRRRVDLAASLMGKPSILFLDEPTTGLDPQNRMELWQMLEKLVDGGMTLLLTTQYLEEADYLADSIVVINHGKVIAEGTSDMLKAKVGNDVLELRLEDRSLTRKAAGAIAHLGKEQPHMDEVGGHIVLSVNEGAKSVVEAIRRLDAEQITIADLFLRRPTLDEAFIMLTGEGIEEQPGATPTQENVQHQST